MRTPKYYKWYLICKMIGSLNLCAMFACRVDSNPKHMDAEIKKGMWAQIVSKFNALVCLHGNYVINNIYS